MFAQSARKVPQTERKLQDAVNRRYLLSGLNTKLVCLHTQNNSKVPSANLPPKPSREYRGLSRDDSQRTS